MQIDDIQDVLRDWEEGNLRVRDVTFLLLELLGEHEVKEVLQALPLSLAEAFSASLREQFDNDVAPVDFLWIDNAGGEPPAKAAIIECARRWLTSEREG